MGLGVDCAVWEVEVAIPLSFVSSHPVENKDSDSGRFHSEVSFCKAIQCSTYIVRSQH